METEKVKYWVVFFLGFGVTMGGVRFGLTNTTPIVLMVSMLLLVMWVLGHIIWYRPPK